jgi:hypothetical protein
MRRGAPGTCRGWQIPQPLSCNSAKRRRNSERKRPLPLHGARKPWRSPHPLHCSRCFCRESTANGPASDRDWRSLYSMLIRKKQLFPVSHRRVRALRGLPRRARPYRQVLGNREAEGCLGLNFDSRPETDVRHARWFRGISILWGDGPNLGFRLRLDEDGWIITHLPAGDVSMPTDLHTLIQSVHPDETILFFGAGSSIPSHAPSVSCIIEHLSTTFRQRSDGFTLADIADLIEQKTKDRRRLIEAVRLLFKDLRPTGGLANVPLYEWKSLYTTNYDELIEDAYKRLERTLLVYSSNFDFSVRGKEISTKLFKLHGTISKDISDGNVARLIISGNDYRYTEEYRQHLYDTFKADLADSNLIIIGHSLSDPDIRELISRAITLNAQALSGGRITLFMYNADADRALLHENQGLRVVFGGIDEFFAELARKSPSHVPVKTVSEDPLDRHAHLKPSTVDIAYEVRRAADVSRVFTGWPATYADLATGLTFERSLTDTVSTLLMSPTGLCAAIVGASGVGKTTAARQVMLRLQGAGYRCWEHKIDHALEVDDWLGVAKTLAHDKKLGVLLVDDAHIHIYELNELIDSLVSKKFSSLKLLIVSSRNSWLPRVKTPNFFKNGKEFRLSRLDSDEINRLIALVDNKPEIRQLVEDTFTGFSRDEKRRRLVERCEADMFVCMKNIFASDSFDDIILREFTELPGPCQEIYRYVAALENAGVRVHRQLIIRLLNVAMGSIDRILEHLTDIVTEYSIDDKKHIYGWIGRHPVISAIITEYKFSEPESIIALFDRVVDNILPTYDIEIRSIRELCSLDTGIRRIPDKRIQNRLLRKMISVAPGERVPRHRLIRNLIEIGEYDQALTEIRIFDKDFGNDGPVARYRINLMVARATRTPKIMLEDRLTILEQAREMAATAIQRYNYVPRVFGAYCEVGIAISLLSGKSEVFDDAMRELKEAETRIGDPEVTRLVRRFDRRMAGQAPEGHPADEL